MYICCIKIRAILHLLCYVTGIWIWKWDTPRLFIAFTCTSL